MAKVCATCGKGSRMGGHRKLLRAHYNPTKWERKQPNLQWATLPVRAGSSATSRVKVCTACIRKNKQQVVVKK
ncbi:MAG: 50S ribosomal protein L28 [Patescibacteria group bacterium]